MSDRLGLGETGETNEGSHTEAAEAVRVRKQEGLYRKLFQHMLHEVHIWQLLRDDDGQIVDWRLVDANPQALKAWGRSLDEVVGLTTEEIFPGGNATQSFLPLIRKITQSGIPEVWDSYFSSTGQHLHMVSIPLGEYFISTGLDITERKEQQAQLKDAFAKLREAIHAGNIGLWDWDLTTNQVHFSPEWKQQLGYEDHEIAPELEEWRSRLHPDDVDTALQAVAAGRAQPDQPYESLFRLRHKDGSYRWILAHASVLMDGQGQPQRLVGSHIDLTQRKLMEEELEKAKRLETVGTLASGIAHDFNNLFAALTLNADILHEEVAQGSAAAGLVDELRSVLKDAGSLARQLLTFSKGGAPIKRVVGPAELVRDSVQLMMRGSGCSYDIVISDDLLAVEVDVGQLSQMLGNLVLNARQAMGEQGHVQVRVHNQEHSAGDPAGPPAGKYVRVSIADQGGGISPEVQEQMFEPFFTTKSSGSGLGLASVRSTVERHGGALSVESVLGEGTTFHVDLPATERAATKRPPNESLRGHEHLLLMDDDSAVRSSIQRVLESLGYEVDVCADGQAALRALQAAEAARQPYDAGLLDVTVRGGLGGLDVLAQVRSIAPSTRIILMTGYAEDSVFQDSSELSATVLLQKPFDLTTVGETLQQVLHPAPANSARS